MTDPTDRTRAFARPASVRVCSVCHGPMWQKHAETCPGPMQRIADPVVYRDECDCKPGYMHEPGCEQVA